MKTHKSFSMEVTTGEVLDLLYIEFLKRNQAPKLSRSFVIECAINYLWINRDRFFEEFGKKEELDKMGAK